MFFHKLYYMLFVKMYLFYYLQKIYIQKDIKKVIKIC